MVRKTDEKARLGRIVPAVLAGLAGSFGAPCAATAQTPQQTARVAPAPDQLTALKMLWSTMAAVDHANRTGNYSVLRDLGTAGFQARNNAAALAGVFATVRSGSNDLSNALIVTPQWEIPPTMIRADLLRMRGSFPLRPGPIRFDLLYGWENGWRLEGISIDASLPSAGERR